MRSLLLLVFSLCALFALAGIGRGQSAVPLKVAKGAGKAAVVVVGSAAKGAWVTTKFTAKYVVKPVATHVAKPIITKALPKVTVFALKLAGKTVTKGLPVAGKYGFKYLTSRLPV